MTSLLLAIPFLTLLSALVLYRHNGKREILRMDLVQFVYAFVFTPISFVWCKSFIYYLIRDELNLKLSQTELFLVDTTYSVLSLYIFSFVVIHSLTKSFKIKRYTDPLYDMFKHSEYYHMWLSHVAIYFGLMVILGFVSAMNILSPFQILVDKQSLYLTVVLGLSSGVLGFLAIWNYDTPRIDFFRLMKLLFGSFFVLHAIAYLTFDISFAMSYAAYWFIFMAYFAAFICSFFFERSKRANSLWQRFRKQLGWRDKF